MGIVERRERSRHELRNRIMDVARELFAREGYEAVSMRKIAQEIEYSPTAIYVHFKDKNALMDEICRNDFGELGTRAAKMATVADPIERIRRVGEMYIRFAVEHPNHYRLMFMTPGINNGQLPAEALARKGDPSQDSYAFLTHAVGEAMAAGRFRPEFTDVQLIVQMLWAAVHGVASLQIAKTDDPWFRWKPLARRTQLMLDVVMTGLTTNIAKPAGNGSHS